MGDSIPEVVGNVAGVFYGEIWPVRFVTTKMRRETLSNNRKRPPKGQTYSKRDQSPSPDPAYSQWPTYCRQSHRNHVPVFSAGKSTLFFGARVQMRHNLLFKRFVSFPAPKYPSSRLITGKHVIKTKETSSYTTWGNPWSQLQTWSTAPNLKHSSKPEAQLQTWNPAPTHRCQSTTYTWISGLLDILYNTPAMYCHA